MTRLVLLHGSVTNARLSWPRQRELEERFDVVRLTRPGFPPGPPVERIDFERDAAWLPSVIRRGDHLVAHSYGGVGALLCASALPLASLTLIEPPAFAVAAGNPVVDAWVARALQLENVDDFLEHVGAPLRMPPEPPEDLRLGAEAFLTERPAHEADVPLDPLPYPVLVVTGAHEPAFEAVADVLCARLGADRVVLPAGGHAVQNAPGFNDALVQFVSQSDAGS